MAKTPTPTFEVISIHPTLPEPMQWQSALELRSAVLWAAETPPATAADYYDADMRGEHLACVPSDPWETAGGSDAVVYGVVSLDGPRLRQLAVRPDARRAGVGAALVEAAVWAPEGGAAWKTGADAEDDFCGQRFGDIAQW